MINQPRQSVGTPVFSAGQDSILSLNVSVNETSRGSFSPPRRYSIPQRSSCIDSDTFAQRRGKELVCRAGCGHGGPDLGRVQTTVVQRSGGAVLSSSRCFGASVTWKAAECREAVALVRSLEKNGLNCVRKRKSQLHKGINVI